MCPVHVYTNCVCLLSMLCVCVCNLWLTIFMLSLSLPSFSLSLTFPLSLFPQLSPLFPFPLSPLHTAPQERSLKLKRYIIIIYSIQTIWNESTTCILCSPSSLMPTMLVRTSPVQFSLHSPTLVPWSSQTLCPRRSCTPSWSCIGLTVRGC